jgi:transcription-repair coupling factor (superfamily II helicase)
VDNLFADISKAPAVQAIARRVEDGGALSFSSISPAAQPFFAALLQKLFPRRTIVVVTENLKAQESFQQDLETWLQVEGCKLKVDSREHQTCNLQPSTFNPLFYPAWEILPHEGKLPPADVISDRLQTLVALAQSEISSRKSQIVMVSVTALLQKTFPPGEIQSRTRLLERGSKIAPLDLIEFLEEQGYEPEAQVSQKGEIALRGGILDVFPPTSPWPVRLEFFGDELESLRYFDPLTQISREEISEVTLPPAGELGILRQQLERGLQPASASGKKKASDFADAADNATLKRPEGRAPFGTLLEYLPRETIFVLCTPDLLAVHAEDYSQQVPSDNPFHISWPDFLIELNRRGFTSVELTDGEWDGTPVSDPARCDLTDDERAVPEAGVPLFASLDAFRPLAERAPEPQIAEAQRREFFQQLHRWLRQNYSVHVFCNNDGERQRFEEIWEEVGRVSKVESREPEASKQPLTLDARPSTHLGSLARGFICEEAKLVVVTDAEIFGRYKIQRPRRQKSSHALAARSALDIDFADLDDGDFVVHLQHGIGRYLGLKIMPVGAGNRKSEIGNRQSETECLVLEYAPANSGDEPPKLYVPVSEAHLVSKYVGAGKASPPLNTLGGTRWAKAKEQTEKAVRDIAAEMLRIQAVRETQPGHPCKPDTQWQREFESAFIYEETRDQITAIAETKLDQERPKPMDRLICGDVGFGKTEVAIRAAFKTVMDGKQVAILVPTTVLAQQHFNNFRERMADYPIRVELLSRYRTRREQDLVVKNLAAGAVDIVIGTHRIVQEDIAFKDLGLVVIDEEQRFGVLHKEKFKRLRTMVDVLTLSATPIPRTLYLALTGARDMSTIQTPPHDRLPVETIATHYDERLIRDAIKRELARGGQVFFLHNRVTTIETMRAKLQSLVPDARIVVGHGQMNADDLEEVMTTFVNGDADVLLSTTIIESGLDIPNANTIIIDRADRFGLSDLYQLRGRVGRYKHQAYAYLLLPRHASLLTDVRKRISAMKQYASLGSGFKIAMRDLEIRGAGNLLGSEQSGHITAVGFELYCQLLKQSVSSLKGEKVKPRVEVRVALDFLQNNVECGDVSPLSNEATCRLVKSADVSAHSKISGAYLPHNYVTEPQHRIEIYRKLAQATDKPALENLSKELRDRFGPLPPPVELLLAVGELKALASEKAVTAIEVEEDKLKITRHNDFITLGGKFPRLTKKEPKARLKEIKRLLLAI